MDVDVGHRNHPARIGLGIARLINFHRRPRVALDLRDLDSRQSGSVTVHRILQRCLEHHHAALIRLAVHILGRVRVGDVLRNDIQPRAFRVERGGCVLNAGENLNHKGTSQNPYLCRLITSIG